MPYATRQDLEDLIPAPDVTAALDDDGDGVEDAGIYDRLADGADRKVNSYLQGRYGHLMPWAGSPPDLCRTAAAAFLAEGLYHRRPGADAPQKIKDAAKEARDALRDIQKGKAHLHSGAVESSPVEIIAEPNPSHGGGGMNV